MTEHTTSNNTPSDEAILEELQRLADELSQSPTMSQFDEYASCDITARGVQTRFDSWNNALQEASLEPNPRPEEQKPVSNAEILEELQRLTDKFGQAPTMDQFDEYASYDIAARGVQKRLNGWNNALERAGLEPNPRGGRVKRVSDADILSKLQQLADELSQSPTMDQFDKYADCDITAAAAGRRFNGWNNALEKAGLEPNPRAGERKPVSNAEILEELQRLTDKLGQAPTMEQFDEYANCDITASGVVRRFDGWNNANRKSKQI